MILWFWEKVEEFRNHVCEMSLYTGRFPETLLSPPWYIVLILWVKWNFFKHWKTDSIPLQVDVKHRACLIWKRSLLVFKMPSKYHPSLQVASTYDKRALISALPRLLSDKATGRLHNPSTVPWRGQQKPGCSSEKLN